MRNKLLILGILGIGIISCTNEKKNDTGVVDNVINEITTPKLFVEGEWVIKNYPIKEAYKDNPYYKIQQINDSTLIFKINAYQGGEKYKYSEKEVRVISISDSIIETKNTSLPVKYIFRKTSDGIKMTTNIHHSFDTTTFIPFK